MTNIDALGGMIKNPGAWDVLDITLLTLGLVLMVFAIGPFCEFVKKRKWVIIICSIIGAILFCILKLLLFIKKTAGEVNLGEYVWYVIFTIPMILAIWFAVRRRRSKNPNPDTELWTSGRPWNPLEKRFWVENEIVIVIAFILFHIVGYTTFDEWWWDHILTDTPVLILQGCMMVFLLMVPKGKTSLHHTLGKWGWKVAFVAIILVVFFKSGKQWVNPFSDGKTSTPSSARNKNFLYGTEGAFVFDSSAPMPACADKRVWDAAHEILADNPFLLAVTARESKFQMYESTPYPDCKPIEGQRLLANLQNGGKGTATGPLQIKPEWHYSFCLKAGANMLDIPGHFKCGLLIHDDDAPGHGAEPWDSDGTPLHFDVTAKPGETFSKPWKLSSNAKFSITFEGDTEIKFGLSEKRDVTILIGADGTVRDLEGRPSKANLMGVVKTISYRARGNTPVKGYVKLSYPVLSSRR